jgi:hypothetical protein
MSMTVPNMAIQSARVEVDTGIKLTVTNVLSASSLNSWTVKSPTYYYPQAPDGLILWTNAALTCKGNGSFSNAYFQLYGGRNEGATGTNLTTLRVDGNLTLKNATRFFTYSAGTNSTFTNYDGLVSVGGTLTMETNAWIYPACDAAKAGGALFSVGNLTIGRYAGFNADGLGWSGWYANSPHTYTARGPGAGWYGSGGAYYGGGSYGGLGGRGTLGTYGSSNAPVLPGSGGGVYGSYQSPGGGLVRIEAKGTIAMDGTISANGGNDSVAGAGGSGGGIYVRCRRFLASSYASIFAKGGNAVQTTGASGGGGRIAIWWITETNSAATISAAGGTTETPGTAGTIVWRNFADRGTMCFIR